MQKVLRYWGRNWAASSVRSRITTQINQGMLMAGEVLKALIFRPKVGESGKMVRRNGRFSLGQARGQPLCIPTWPLHTKAFILGFARQLFKAVINGHKHQPDVNLIIWCYLGVINS